MNEIVNLQDLAIQINTEHELCQSAMKASFEHALKVGELLIEAKSLVDHGDWLPWIAENCEFSERSARAYMRVTKNWPELSKTAAAAVLTIRGALQMLEAPKEPIPQETTPRSFTSAIWGDDKARAYDDIMQAHQDGYIEVLPIGLKALPKLEETGRADVFWIGLMAELLIIHGPDHTNPDPPDHVKWWIGDWLNYGREILPNVREYFDKACAAAYYLTTPEAKALMDAHYAEGL